MFVEDCNKLGGIYKAYGIRGELIIRTDLELSDDLLKKWESIFININGILVPFFIEEIFQKSENELQIKLEDIENELQVKEYVRKEVFIDKADYQPKSENLGIYKYQNYQIHNEEGLLLGDIKELLNYPGQIMLVVNSKDGEEVIIPAIEEWIISSDEDENTIVMRLPDGLFDLNKKEDFF